MTGDEASGLNSLRSRGRAAPVLLATLTVWACSSPSTPSVGTKTDWTRICQEDAECDGERVCQGGLCRTAPAADSGATATDTETSSTTAPVVVPDDTPLPMLFLDFTNCGGTAGGDPDLLQVACGTGVSGSGGRFAGESAPLEFLPPLGAFERAVTVSAWVRPDLLTGGPTLVGRWYAPDQFLLLMEDGVFRFAITLSATGSTSITAIAPTAAMADRWTHVAGVFDGAAAALYVDGARVAEVAAPGTLAATTRPISLGGHPSWAAFQGTLDDVGIYDAALTTDQIGRLYTAHAP